MRSKYCFLFALFSLADRFELPRYNFRLICSADQCGLIGFLEYPTGFSFLYQQNRCIRYWTLHSPCIHRCQAHKWPRFLVCLHHSRKLTSSPNARRAELWAQCLLSWRGTGLQINTVILFPLVTEQVALFYLRAVFNAVCKQRLPNGVHYFCKYFGCLVGSSIN